MRLREFIEYQPHTSIIQTGSRIILGMALVYTGLGHLLFLRQEFQAQVPPWVPLDVDLVVVLSGYAELILGISLVFLFRYQAFVGWLVAAFFIVIFPGNLSQYFNGIDAFGLDTDMKRFIRLFFQPVLVIWALWSTGAWGILKNTES